jgi:hypothetical protein
MGPSWESPASRATPLPQDDSWGLLDIDWHLGEKWSILTRLAYLGTIALRDLAGAESDSTNVRADRPDCHEIVMVARPKRIISKQNGSNRPICNPLKRGIE